MTIRLVTVLAVLLLLLPLAGLKVEARSSSPRPSRDGHLTVSGTKLVNENKQQVILRGLSTHGLTWYPQYVNEKMFSFLAGEWECSLIRLAMYSEIYSLEDRKTSLSILHKGIDAAIASDMYVMVDWHILNDSDPNINADKAEAFFDGISKEYGNIPNIIYEICNEPNGDTKWNDICRYADRIIPIIRTMRRTP